MIVELKSVPKSVVALRKSESANLTWATARDDNYILVQLFLSVFNLPGEEQLVPQSTGTGWLLAVRLIILVVEVSTQSLHLNLVDLREVQADFRAKDAEHLLALLFARVVRNLKDRLGRLWLILGSHGEI